MEEHKLNSTPHLTMQEITIKLFNNKFLSDIEFSVNGKSIYAHSLELMKRSIVFQELLETTMSVKKFIPIINTKFDSFLQFIRFIYTDNCEINDDNGIELLKLAIKYQVITLENRVINTLKSVDWVLQLFEFCVVEKYEIARIRAFEYCSVFFVEFIKSNKFVSLHQDAVNEILKFDRVKQGVTEMQIFDALASWIKNYCNLHQMSLESGGLQFDNLIRQIRFPTMSKNEILECTEKYPGLLNENHCMSISTQMMFGRAPNNQWISLPRDAFKPQYEFRNFRCNTAFVTSLTVSKEILFHGCQIGVEINRKNMIIKIIAMGMDSNKVESIQFTQYISETWWGTMLISLGNSVLFKPGFKYTIAVEYLEVADNDMHVLCRKANVDIILNIPEDEVQFIKKGENMLQMAFKSPS